MSNIQFWRSYKMSDTSFLDLVYRTFGKTFTKGIDAKNWLITNGYYTSYPDIVTDGLVLYLDAANSSSFKGEPTTNLFPDIIGQSSKYNVSQYLGKQDNLGAFFQYNTATHGTYTLSADVKIYPDDTATNMRMTIVAHYTDGTTPYVSNFNMIKDETRRYLTVTITTDTGKTLDYIYGWVLDYSTPGTLRHFDANNIQLEQKSYATPFVNGTRGTTFATGGGWCDLSGNGNHGELVNSPLYNSSNLGNVVFDNTANKLIKTNISSFGNNTTWSAWVNFSSKPATYNMFMGQTLPYFSMYNNNSFIISNTISSVQRSIQTSAIYSINTWYYLTITTEVSGGNTIMNIYVNGEYATGNSFAGTQSVGTGVFSIGDGRDNDWYRFNGKISYVSIYNRTLSSAEITQNFNATKERFGL